MERDDASGPGAIMGPNEPAGANAAMRDKPCRPDAETRRESAVGPHEQSRRRTLTALAIAVLLGAGVWFLIGEVAHYSQLIHALERADLWWLIASVVAASGVYPGYALLYRALVRVVEGPRVRLGLAFRVTIAVLGASVIATAAGRLGCEYWTLRQLREPTPKAWSRVLAINTLQWAILATLALLGAVALLLGAGHGAPLGVELAWVIPLPLCVLAAGYLSAPARRSLTEDQGGPPRRALASALRGIVLLRLLGHRRHALLRSLTGALLIWVSEMLTVWTALHAFGISLAFSSLVVGYATGCVSTILPLPAGGAGGVDAASTYALTLVGVPLGPALLATLVQRLCIYWLPLLLALASAPTLRRLRGDLEQVTQDASTHAATTE